MSRPSVVIVSPAPPAANTGNARTAARWQELLAPAASARVVQQWPDAEAAGDTVMLALHARRSAPAIEAWAQAHPGRGLAVVLTGTDLYQDVAADAAAAQSLERAQRLVVLQECGADALAPHLRAKARVVFQSAPALPAASKPADRLDAIAVGHLRAVKAPQTLFAAARLLRPEEGIRITHVGDGSGDTALREAAEATARHCPHYSWLGAVPHAQTRARIQQAHLLLHPSLLEGGAHVVMEAVRSGTPVLASRVPGNVGMLGADYKGYFPVGDAAALAALLRRCRRPGEGLLARRAVQCAARAPLFDAARERQALLGLLAELVPAPP
jgi:putative glycosyltransferase (TIGR04348 family)